MSNVTTTTPLPDTRVGEPATLAREITDALARFIADVLHRAHVVADAEENPDAARVILHVALLFADDLSAADPRLDHMQFVESITASR